MNIKKKSLRTKHRSRPHTITPQTRAVPRGALVNITPPSSNKVAVVWRDLKFNASGTIACLLLLLVALVVMLLLVAFGGAARSTVLVLLAASVELRT